MQCPEVRAEEDVLVEVVARLDLHEKRGAIDSCDDAPHQECERVWCELRAESRLPHVPVGLLSWRLANVIASHAD